MFLWPCKKKKHLYRKKNREKGLGFVFYVISMSEYGKLIAKHRIIIFTCPNMDAMVKVSDHIFITVQYDV